MKKTICLFAAIALLTSVSYAWLRPGEDATNPILAGHYISIYGVNILPLVANTGSIGSATNAFNASWQDTVNVALIKLSGNSASCILSTSNGQGKFNGDEWLVASGRFGAYAASTAGFLYGTTSTKTAVLSALDTTSAWVANTRTFVGKAAGSTITSDTNKVLKGLITDSTAYVLKRIFMRNDSLFFVVNTDTFRVVKK